MDIKTKMFFVRQLLSDEEQCLEHLSNLEAEDLLEVQAIADKITELIVVVLTARQLYVEMQTKNVTGENNGRTEGTETDM